MLVMKELNDEEQRTIEIGLMNYDYKNTKVNLNKRVSLGIYDDDLLIAGANASIEAYRIMYIETVFVSDKYRRQGFGRMLIELLEEKAKEIGAHIIRLDTFSWQGRDFYLSLGYEIVGSYELEDGYMEYFFIKRL